MSYHFISTSGTNLLSEPNTAVISQEKAKKYFGDENPIGKTFQLDGERNFKITGVFKDMPENMHYKADILLSYINWEQQIGDNINTFGWVYSGFYTYVKLKEGVSPMLMDKKIETMLQEELGEFMERYKLTINHRLQPVKDIHLTSHFMHELRSNGNRNSVKFLHIIAWFIILIAWINFVNLLTINSIKRMGEISLRKVLGSTSSRLILQFVLESVLINMIALIIALVIMELFRPFYIQVTGLPASFTFWSQGWFWYHALIIFIAGTLLAGSYPIWGILSSKIVANLKSTFTGSKNSVLLRKSLVVFQFFMAVILIAGTISVSKQLQYLKEKETGFNKNNVLVVHTPRIGGENILSQRKSFKEAVGQFPFVKNISYSSVIPGKHNMFNRGGIYRVGDEPTSGKNYRVTEVDHHYLDVYSNVILAGRNFSEDYTSDKEAVILNATATELLGFESPQEAVKEKIVMRGQEKTIIGVIQNFHQESPRNEFEPQIFRMAKRFDGYFSLKLAGSNYENIQRTIQKEYESFFPGNPFDFFYLDDFYQAQYKREEQFGDVFGGFSILAIIITILGILSLSSFSAAQRKKEIGIRKTLGASKKQVVYLLSKSYVLLLIIAFLLSIPIIYWGLDQWLNNFANRMPLSVWIFVIPVITVSMLSLITVSVQSAMAAEQNPVDSLRYE
jgi:putative ABC transport system permease protein